MEKSMRLRQRLYNSCVRRMMQIRRRASFYSSSLSYSMIFLLMFSPGSLSAERGSDFIAEGKELVNINFPEPTDIKDIIKAVSKWTGRNVIIGNVSGRIQIISPKKVTKKEAYQAFLSALNMLGFTTIETGKVIKIVKVLHARKGNVRIYPGSNWAPKTDAIITQIIPLKYVDSKKVTATLSKLIQSNAIVAYEPTNTIIITDTGFQIGRALDIIKEIDVQTQQPKVLMVPIIHSDPKSIATKVNEILKTGSGSGRTASRSSYNTFKVLTDERTHSVIIFGPPRTIRDIRELVKKFDVPVIDPASEATIHVRTLNYAKAKELATTLSALTSATKTKRSTPIRRAGGKPAASSALPLVASLSEGVKIAADEATNSLLITGPKSSYDALNKIIQQLDKRRPQVYVEAEILELAENDEFKSNMSVFFAKEVGDSLKAITGWDGARVGSLIKANVQDNAGTTVATTSIAEVISAFSQDLSIGIISGTKINIPGLGEFSPGGLINIIKNDGNTRIISSPQILTSNNQEAILTVGEKRSFTTSDINASGVTATKVETIPVDLTLTIKPNISYSGYVTLDIDLKSDYVISTEAGTNIPLIANRKTKQIVTAKTGQTIVISGLLKTSEIEEYKKVPLLGDLPLLGWFFRNSNINKTRKNLVMFITPYIVHGGADLAAIYEAKIKERNQFLESMYGTLDDDFYRSIPQLADGAYNPSEFDRLEDEHFNQQRKAMLRDAGVIEEEKKIEREEVEQVVPIELQNQEETVLGLEPSPVQVEEEPEIEIFSDQEEEEPGIEITND